LPPKKHRKTYMVNADMAGNSDTIDFSRLGFEIAVPATDESSRNSLQVQVEQAQQAASDNLEYNIEYNIVRADELSCVSLDTYYNDDDDDDDISFAPPPTKTMPRRTDYRCAELSDADLGYESVDQPPSRANLGYCEEPDLGYGDEPGRTAPLYEDAQTQTQAPAETSSIRLLKVGRPVHNRRSMGLAVERRRTNDSMLSGRFSRRHSTCSGTTISSKNSSKMPRTHCKTKTVSQRERMVTRSASRRLSRQHPAQPQSQNHATQSAYLTLQDLGCSDLFSDPRCRVPRRVSLEYGNDGHDSVASCRQPRTVCLEFDNSSMSNNNGLVPRRVSIKYDQRCQADDDPNGRVLTRRGSLDFSVGTSCLPRRASLGKSSAHSQVQQHQHQQEAERSFQHSRRASCSGGYEANYYSAPNSRRCSLGSSVIPQRQYSDNSLNTRISRRSSIAHIPRNQIKNATVSSEVSPKARTIMAECRRLSMKHVGAVETTNITAERRRLSLKHVGAMEATTIMAGRRRLSLKHVGAVEYLTRDTLVGRSA
jgi:hypothetical protein